MGGSITIRWGRGGGRGILVEKRVGCNVRNTFIDISSITEVFFKFLASKMSLSKLLQVTTRHAYFCAVNTVMNKYSLHKIIYHGKLYSRYLLNNM